jgi:hypothetical protein
VEVESSRELVHALEVERTKERIPWEFGIEGIDVHAGFEVLF